MKSSARASNSGGTGGSSIAAAAVAAVAAAAAAASAAGAAGVTAEGGGLRRLYPSWLSEVLLPNGSSHGEGYSRSSSSAGSSRRQPAPPPTPGVRGVRQLFRRSKVAIIFELPV